MNISEHLIKDYWVRRVNPDSAHTRGATTGAANYKSVIKGGRGVAYVNLTQDDFLNEIEPAAHAINSAYMSKRPIYAPTGKKDKNGKEEWAISGYDDVESVALGLQSCLAVKKATHFAGDGFWIANESKNEDGFEKLSSWKDSIDLNAAFMEAVNSCFTTGDAAIYLYQRGNNIEYEVFSYNKGDVLYPDFDENRNPVLYRKYTFKGKEAVDVFTTRYRETWVMLDKDNSTSWLEKMRGWIRNGASEVSEDGYTLISRTEAQTGNDLLQVVYFRVPDIPSGVAQCSIESLEEACSYVSEEVKNSAFPILFLKSEKIINLPPNEMNGKTIGVRGSSETVQHSDAKFLAPPDASNIATLNIKTLTDNILRSTMSVFIEPEILKSGADSSTTIKILYSPEIQWCKKEWIYFAKPVKQLVEVLKTLVGKVEGLMTSEFANMRVSVGQNIWIPQNESERVKIELDQVYARVKSRKAAMQDIGNQHIGDEQQIIKEWEQELDIKSRVPAEAKAKVEQEYGVTSGEEIIVEDEPNPNKPNVDNNDKGKTITE